MWDQTYGCAKQYRCSIAYYIMSFLSKSYPIVFDRSVYTTGRGKDVVYVFNAIQKQYLATCLRMCILSEVENIYSKRMLVDTMTNNGEVSYAEECKHLLDLSYDIGTKGDKKPVTR